MKIAHAKRKSQTLNLRVANPQWKSLLRSCGLAVLRTTCRKLPALIITPSESILIYSWIITNFQKHACFKQFVWACCNIFASFFALDVLFRTCSFISLRLFCRNRSFYPCLRSFNFMREPRIHWKKCGWKSRAHFTWVISRGTTCQHQDLVDVSRW